MAYTFNTNYLKAQETPPPWLRTPYSCSKPLRVNDMYSMGNISCGLNELYINKFRGNTFENIFYLKPVLNGEYARPGGIGIHSPILQKNDSMFMQFYPYNANWAEFKNNHFLYNSTNTRLGIDQYDPLDWPNYTQVDNGLYNGIFEVTSANPTDPDCPDTEPYYIRMYAGPQNFLFGDGPDLDFYGGGSGDYSASNLPALGDIGYKCHEFGMYNKVGYDFLHFGTKNLVPLKQFWEKKRIGIRISGASGGLPQEKIVLVDFTENCGNGGFGTSDPPPSEDPDGNIALTQSLLACDCRTLPFILDSADRTAIMKPIIWAGRPINVVEKWVHNLPNLNDFKLIFDNTTGCQDVVIVVNATYNGVAETKTVCLSALKFNIDKIQLFFHKMPDTYEIKFYKKDIQCIIGGNNGN